MVVTGTEVLGFTNIEIKRKPERNLQTDFIKLMLKHKGDRQHRGNEGSPACLGLALLGCFYKLGEKPDCKKRQAFWKRQACGTFHFTVQ